MRIGFAYDLVTDWAGDDLTAEQTGEFDTATTIDAISDHFTRRGHVVQRIGRARALIAALSRGDRWDIVFNICEGLSGPGREALVPALLEGFSVPYVFSDALVLALTLHKGHTKRVVRDAGLPTADFRVLEHPTSVMDLAFPVFIKPVAEGSGKGIGPDSLCHSARDLVDRAAHLITRFDQPVLVETLLPGREFTVGIIGAGEAAAAIGVMEIVSEATYGFEIKTNDIDVRYALADDEDARAAAEVALGAWRMLGCRDCGRVDLRADGSGRPMFLEVNPLAGLNPVNSDLVILARLAGHDYGWLLDRIMESACARTGLTW